MSARGRGRGNIPIVEEEVSSVGSHGHSTHDTQAGLGAPAPVKFKKSEAKRA